MTRESGSRDVDRRTFLKLAGGAGATVAVAGCTGDGGDGGGTTTTTGGDGGTTTTAGDGDGGDGGDGDGDGGTESFELVVTQGQMDSGLDPQDHSETPTDNIVRQAYEGLLDRDAEGAVIEGLATEWNRVEAGTVTFTLREGVTFHNGDALTAEDVVFSIRRIVDDDVGIASTQKNDLGAVTEVTASDGEVTVNFDGLNPIAFQLFATNGDIMQKSWVEENSRDYINRNTNGTGPFTATSYDSGNEVVFERFDDYWKGPAAATKVTFNAASESSTRVNRLLQGETDITVNVPPQDINRVQNSDAATVTPVPSTRVLFCFMRYDVEPFTSQEFRQAMNYAIDLDSIIQNVLNGFGAPTGQPTLEPFVGYNPDVDPYPYDPDQAESLVEESGFSGASITLQTPIGRYLKDVEIAQAVSNQIDQLSNVSCELQQREFSALVQDLTTGNIEDKPPFSLLGWGNGEFDAAQTIIPLLTSDGALTTFKNDEIDGLIADAQSEPDQEARVEILREANARLHDLAPWVFLNRQFSLYGQSTRMNWTARSDEAIDVYTASPK